MKKSICLRLIAVIAAILVLYPALTGCQNGKKFDSDESMISEMTGTYSGSNEHGGERIVIDGTNVIQFNIDDIFPEITDYTFFSENFPRENWGEFDINVLLSKPYIEITTEPISANIKESTISGLWIDKNGVLLSQKGFPLSKTSSESVYPTAEMQEKFEEYRKYLQEYEKSTIIAEAKSNYSEKKDALESALSSAASSNSTPGKSTASAETIANCAFESLKDHLKYPRTATMDGYSTSPQYDPYGRVATLIGVTSQNGFGNYITEDVYVVLQSCSSFGSYTYNPGGMHFTKDKSYFSMLLIVNGWETDPSLDDAKETSYKKAITSVKNKRYATAIDLLDELGDYKSSAQLKNACISFSVAEKYNAAIELFAEGQYAEASKKLYALLEDYGSGQNLTAERVSKSERVILFCNMAISNLSSNNGDASGEGNTTNDSSASDSDNNSSSVAPKSSLSDYLDFSKVWYISWLDSNDNDYYAYYVFEEDGTCYMVMSAAGTEIISIGMGTYTFDGKHLSFNLECDGVSLEYAYDFEPEDLWLTQTSKTGLAYNHTQSSGFQLGVQQSLTVAQIKEKFGIPSSTGVSGSTNSAETTSVSGNSSCHNGTAGKSEPSSSSSSVSGSDSPSGDSNTSQQPVSCSHNYAAATCVTPKTCTQCGATTGSTTDHVWEYTSCSTPKACSVCGQALIGSAPGHVWEQVTETVHHEEQGHYGEVQVAKKVTKYRCWLCSYAQSTYGTVDEYYSHFDSTHAGGANNNSFRERYETVEDWDYVYETQWIVDTPAYSETVIKGYKCSACGKEKQD